MAKEGAKISVSDFNFKLSIVIGPIPINIITHGKYLTFGSNDKFRFEIESLSQLGVFKSLNARIMLEVSYNKKDSENFVRIFEVGKLFDDTTSGHFIGDLPVTKSVMGSDLIGDVKVGFIGGDLLEKFRFEIHNKFDRSVLSLDDALEYLQCLFL